MRPAPLPSSAAVSTAPKLYVLERTSPGRLAGVALWRSARLLFSADLLLLLLRVPSVGEAALLAAPPAAADRVVVVSAACPSDEAAAAAAAFIECSLRVWRTEARSPPHSQQKPEPDAFEPAELTDIEPSGVDG